MTEKKNAEGLRYLFKLDACVLDTNKLLTMAKEAINESHDKRTFMERRGYDLQVNASSVFIGATIAMSHALMNSNLSTNDKLYMIMNKYINTAKQKNTKISKEKALEQFCQEFAKAYPAEFGIEKKHINTNIMLNKQIRTLD